MRKKIFKHGIIVVLMCASLSLAGCGKDEPTTTEQTTVTTTEATIETTTVTTTEATTEQTTAATTEATTETTTAATTEAAPEEAPDQSKEDDLKELGFTFKIPEGFKMETNFEDDGALHYCYEDSNEMTIEIILSEKAANINDMYQARKSDARIKEITLDNAKQDGFVVSGYMFDSKDYVFYDNLKVRRGCYAEVSILYKNDANKEKCDKIVQNFINNIDYGTAGD